LEEYLLGGVPPWRSTSLEEYLLGDPA